jgi:hypothetical protein
MSHWLASAFVILALRLLFGESFALWAVPVIVIAAAIKEFWYDMHHESPSVSGGVEGGVQDFLFYTLGLGIALVILLIARY